MKSCRQPIMEDLGKIKKLRIARGPIVEGDLEGMNNLAKLEIVELGIPLETRTETPYWEEGFGQ